MPCTKCSNGKYKLGGGPCMYKSKESCERAYVAYRAKKHSGPRKHHSAQDGPFLESRKRKFGVS